MAYMPCNIIIIALLLHHTYHINETHCTQWVNPQENYHKTLMKMSQTCVGKYIQTCIHTLLSGGPSFIRHIQFFIKFIIFKTKNIKLLKNRTNYYFKTQYTNSILSKCHWTGFEIMTMKPCLPSNISGTMPAHMLACV